MAQLNNRRDDFSPCFLCRKRIACFLVHPPPMPYNNSQTESMLCVTEHRCVCSYSYVPILLARDCKLCQLARTCIIPPSRLRRRSHSQCCCVAFSGAVFVITTTSSSFQSCVRLQCLYPFMYVYLPKFNKQMHYYDSYRSFMGIFVTVNIKTCFGTKYDANLEIMSCQVLF